LPSLSSAPPRLLFRSHGVDRLAQEVERPGVGDNVVPELVYLRLHLIGLAFVFEALYKSDPSALEESDVVVR
jgi:hypothetical protein